MEFLGLTRPRAIIFDWDNTLVDTWPIIHAALERTFREMGQPGWTLEQTMARVRKSMRDSFPEVFGENWQEAAKRYQSYYREIHLDKLTPLPGAAEVLSRVRELALFSTVVSNKKGDNLRTEIAALKWEPYFDSAIGADDAQRDKPHADPVHMAFDKSGLTPSADVWFVGDSEIDLECAEATGCTAILYGEHAKAHPSFNGTHYHGFAYQAHVHNHEELLKLLA